VEESVDKGGDPTGQKLALRNEGVEKTNKLKRNSKNQCKARYAGDFKGAFGNPGDI